MTGRTENLPALKRQPSTIVPLQSVQGEAGRLGGPPERQGRRGRPSVEEQRAIVACGDLPMPSHSPPLYMTCWGKRDCVETEADYLLQASRLVCRVGRNGLYPQKIYCVQ